MSTNATATQKTLQAGIRALRAGEREEARALLTKVVTADEHNEQAWLWLSSAVDTAEERRICLENALTLNPHNTAAREELAKLAPAETPEETVDPPAEEAPPAVEKLYRKREYTGGGGYETSIPLQRRPEIGYQTESSFDDVWSRAESLTLCAFCAQEVEPDARRCPHCKRKLVLSLYQYDRPTTNFHVFWVLLLGLSQLFLIQVIFDIISRADTATIWLHGALVPVWMILTLFVYRRHFWAYIASMVTLALSGTLILTAGVITDALTATFAGTTINTPLFGLTAGASQTLFYFVRVLQLACIGFALVVGFFFVAPDFSRDKVRLLARLKKGANTAGQAAAAGERYSRRRMWAAAVLHWRKAVALDPGRLLYYLNLADAYARIGFYARSLDVLQSAEMIVTTAAAKAKIEEMRTGIEAKMSKNS